jgi:hypothetical protein
MKAVHPSPEIYSLSFPHMINYGWLSLSRSTEVVFSSHDMEVVDPSHEI